MNMVERVARAISSSFLEDGAFWNGKWESESDHAAFIASARTAIEAMRMPTEAMVEAAFCQTRREVYFSGELARAKWWWKTMVDTALSEK